MGSVRLHTGLGTGQSPTLLVQLLKLVEVFSFELETSSDVSGFQVGDTV